jgi:hypothetical protein|tara:strand:- start:1032 stop:1220 length:189 start_codon:yes stop_codon:yes gene_type:complete
MHSNTLFSLYCAAHDKHGQHSPITAFLGVTWLEARCIEDGVCEINLGNGMTLEFDAQQRSIH